MPCLTFTILTAPKKISTLKFLPHTDNWLAGRPYSCTDHYINSHFSFESKQKTEKAITAKDEEGGDAKR